MDNYHWKHLNKMGMVKLGEGPKYRGEVGERGGGGGGRGGVGD